MSVAVPADCELMNFTGRSGHVCALASPASANAARMANAVLIIEASSRLRHLMAGAAGPIGMPSHRRLAAAMFEGTSGNQPMNPLNLPRPAWMTEEHALLEEQADRFLKAEFG